MDRSVNMTSFYFFLRNTSLIFIQARVREGPIVVATGCTVLWTVNRLILGKSDQSYDLLLIRTSNLMTFKSTRLSSRVPEFGKPYSVNRVTRVLFVEGSLLVVR